MQSKVRAAVSGLGACVALGLFLVGVPICLVMVVGNPLPAGVPEWSAVVAAIESGALPTGAVRGVLAIAVWIWWSQAALSFAAEVRAACRGRTARSLPLRGLGMQPVIVCLVAVVVAAAGTVGTLAQPVLAGTPSFAEIAVPMDAGGQADERSAAIPATTGMSPRAPDAGSPPAPILGPPEGAGPDREAAAPAPILGTPVGPRLAQSPARPAASVEQATSARWDPVVALQAAPPADHLTAAADQVTAAAYQVTAAAHQVTAAEPGESGWVVVKPGDSLWLLAERHLGDALRWPDIFELNVGQLEGGGTLRDPNLIHPGWRLRLPPPDQPDHSAQRWPASPATAVAATASAAPTEPASG
ncbi:MAG: LysM peptidoglycan-binding domain-containing protein [Acidimicrobiia bacterium]|nr:LysM peptidoglycan-binding domain-containing protein [Acidimicrobiia bacterium]